MEQSPSWKTDGHSAGQEIPRYFGSFLLPPKNKPPGARVITVWKHLS
jgi:hypothetical protein